MDAESLARMTEADLGSDFSEEEMEVVSTTAQGPSTAQTVERYPSLFERTSTFGRSFPKSEYGKSDSEVVPTKCLSVQTVSAIPGDQESTTQVVTLDALPLKYQSFFSDYIYFNIVQSKVFNDVYKSDNSIAICSPTSSGKTGKF